MSNTYPSDAALERIKAWDFNTPLEWFAYIKQAGNWWPDPEPWGWSEEDVFADDFDGKRRRFHISTGGWSGNEDILSAMEENFMLWGLTWQSSRRGGHYVFEVRLEEGQRG